MSPISRRHFCQFAGSALATLGLSQVNIKGQGDLYGKVLAQSTPRKLALLVGINKYQGQPLKGCLNDVELQRHLLTHRFGFNPKDILTVTDEEATREGILEAFEEHLIKQAKPGDVVVYKFSGHGSRVEDPDPIFVSSNSGNSGLNSTFVPVNSGLPAGYPEQGGVVQDIMGHTLFLLMSAVKSENFTAVLDSCYSGGGTREGFLVRSRDGGNKIQISPEEKAYQQKWLSRLNWSREEFVKRYRAGVAKGVVLAATNPNQLAADVPFNGFSAGAFTYSLTQYLWQQTSTVERAIAKVNSSMPTFPNFEQTSIYDAKVGSNYEQQPVYLINPTSSAADAVITDVNGNQATLWLGGLDRQSLGDLEDGSAFAIIGSRGSRSGKVTLKSRKGLVAEATVEGVAKPGTLLRKVG